MAQQVDRSDDAFRAAKNALTSAYEDGVRAIEQIADAQRSFDLATELAADLRRIADDAARVRAMAAVRIRDGEQLSLAGLAQRISVSRARADQMIKAATTKPVPPTEED